MQQIQHIVHLMLENRSLDNVLGWLYKNTNPKNIIPQGSSPVFNGLQTGSYYNPDSNGTHVPVTTVPAGNMQVPSVDPHEPYQHVNTQLFGQAANPVPGTPADMLGFYKDFSTTSSGNFAEILQCYDPATLAVINSLAAQYAVSDAYFASVPTQTLCNRGFAAAGNSIGKLFFEKVTAMVDNHWDEHAIDPFTPVEFTGRTIWDVLSENGFGTAEDWMIYYSEYWTDLEGYCLTEDLFWPSLKKYKNFSNISNFYTQAKEGTLPAFSYLEPVFFEKIDKVGWNGNDYHPPANLAPGEAFLLKVFTAVLNSPQWENTLLIINFDEHGGTYDHVPPPWGAKAPWADPSDGTSKPPHLEQEFQFDRFGVRVPLILISPLIQPSTVFRSATGTPYDHTSVIATILNNFGIAKSSWQLGSRVANAPTFEEVVSLSVPRKDIPAIEVQAAEEQPEKTAPNDLQLMIAGRMLLRAVRKSEFPRDEFKTLYDAAFKYFETVDQLMSVTYSLLKKIAGKE